MSAGPAVGPSASIQAPNASQLTITFTALFPAGAGAAAQALSSELEEQSAKLLDSVIAGHGPIIISGAPPARDEQHLTRWTLRVAATEHSAAWSYTWLITLHAGCYTAC